ncbi:MAG: hypothetical protein PWQ96_564 [Clostridia bacterium]|jgi:diguanylate cyclase (GGDEF)-like protein/PAS domain S-box-containing protein|nr:hypothetical protein [Clostridia bacterium]
MSFDTSELLILYDIFSFSFPAREKDLVREIIEKSTRMFGVRRLALITGDREHRKCLGYWGFQRKHDVWEEIEKEGDNRFLYNLRNGKLGLLYLEQVNPLSSRDRRLYTIFARRVEEVLNELKRTEELKRFRSLMEQINDAIFLIDAKNGKFFDANQTACKWLSCNRNKLVKMNVLDIQSDITKSWKQIIRKVRGAEEGLIVEGWYRRKNGRKFPVSVSLRLTEFGEEECIVAVARDITEQKQAEKQIKYLSFHDKLTGLYNRTYFEEEMHRLEKSRSFPVSIIVGDLDGLKIINDTLGHYRGDELLRRFARIIRDQFRSSDVVARIGGDEFAIILPQTSRQTVEEVIFRIRRVIEENNVHEQLPLSISLGTATAENPGQSLWETFKEADNRMYRDKLARGTDPLRATVRVLKLALAEKDYLASGHTERLKKMTRLMGEALGLSSAELSDLSLLAEIHDIGKLGVPDYILCKPSALSEKEKEEIKKHPEIGYRIACSIPVLVPIAELIRQHHEWWNGEGYPQGLRGEEVNLLSRILAIADAYDAMTSDRPYRKALSKEKALAELRRCEGIQFDPTLVGVFEKIILEQYE